MASKHNPGCKCCCQEPCITIEGYNTPQQWFSQEPSFGDECAKCCWTRKFIIDSPSETYSCTDVCNNASNSRWIVSRTATHTDIRVYYSQSSCDCDPEPSGKKWFITIEHEDIVKYRVWYNYGGFFGPVPTCQIPCPPVACDQFTCPGCEWYDLGECSDDIVKWYRTKVFTTKPSGNITFDDDDIVSCLYDSYPDMYSIPCQEEPQSHVTVEQCATRDLIACVNARLSANGFGFRCSGTNNVNTCFSSPTVTINAC